MAYVSPVYACARGRGRIHARASSACGRALPLQGERTREHSKLEAQRGPKVEEGLKGDKMDRSTPAPYMIRLTPSAAPHW